jgi:hypothetical protein
MLVSGCQPIVEFYKLIQDGRPPKRADRSAAGYLPSRAMRYCDALSSATGYGYWVFPATDLQFIWDGERISWAYGANDEWLPLSETASGAVQFPDFEEQFDAAAPEEMRGLSIPFLTAGLEPGSLQIWTGLVARTRPGWSLSVRQPVNLPPPVGYSCWEAIIETDQWFGPIFTVIKISKTDVPVRLRADVPFLQIQPVPQVSYGETTLSGFSNNSMDDMSATDWEALHGILNPEIVDDAKPGAYAVRVRKRRMCPAHQVVMNSVVSDAS